MEMNLIVFPIEEKATAGDQTAASIYKKVTGTFLRFIRNICRHGFNRAKLAQIEFVPTTVFVGPDSSGQKKLL